MTTAKLPCTIVQAKEIAKAADLAGYFEKVEDTNCPEHGLYIARGKNATVTVELEGNGWTRILDAESENPEEYDKFVETLWDQYLNQADNRGQNRQFLTHHVETAYTGQCDCLDRLRSIHMPEPEKACN